MCCGSNPNYPPSAQRARCWSFAVLFLSIIGGVVEFLGSALYGWLGGLGCILAIVASGILVCCAPFSSGPGTGTKFKVAGILAAIASFFHLASFIAVLVVVNTIRAQLNEECGDQLCGNGAWQKAQCETATCASETQCREYELHINACAQFASAAAAWLLSLSWPVIIFSLINCFTEVVMACYCFPAANGMNKGVASGQPVASAQPVAYGTAQPVAYGVAQPQAQAVGQVVV